MNTTVDAVVIGGGPAGATTALLLARSGWSVALIEKKTFPRTKVCGEFISATSLPLMQELGVRDFYEEHAGPTVSRVGWFGAEKILTATMPSLENSLSKWGRALGREHFDTALIDKAKEAGVDVWQPWTARDLIDSGNGFICRIENKAQKAEITARIVIIAQGSWEKPLIKTPEKPHKNSDLLAFKAHFRDSQLDLDLMSLISFPGGYGGLVHSDENRVTLSCCIRRDILQKLRLAHSGLSAGDVALNYIMSTCGGVRQTLGNAQRDDLWLSVGPLQPGIRKCYENGVFYAGNIAGEAHPIIAEGISMAMQSGWLLAQSLTKQSSSTRADLAEIGRQYTLNWRKQFVNRIRAARLFAHVTSRHQGMALLLPLIERFPGLLTFAANLSGKAKKLRGL